MIEDTLLTEQPPVSKDTLIERYEKTYRDALSVIDNEVKDLIENGREMTGLFLYVENLSIIMEVHEALTGIYSIVYSNKDVLYEYNSKRIRQLNQSLVPTLELVNDQESSQEKRADYVLRKLEKIGSIKTHRLINTRIISELEYMIRTLKTLVEPDFELPHESEEEESEETPD